jgi:hypothetical protein
MTFTFTVTVEVERTQGKFATREELAEQIISELEGANPGTLEGENGGEYEVSDFTVEETATPKPERRRKVAPVAPAAFAAPVAPVPAPAPLADAHAHVGPCGPLCPPALPGRPRYTVEVWHYTGTDYVVMLTTRDLSAAVTEARSYIGGDARGVRIMKGTVKLSQTKPEVR